MPARSYLYSFFFFGMALFAFMPVCSAGILVNNGQLTIQVDGMPLTAVLEEIGRQGNISIQTKEPLAGQMVTIHLGPLPLEKGLKRILYKNNYLATFDQAGNIIKLTISRKASSPGTYMITPPADPMLPAVPEPSEIVPPQEQSSVVPESPTSEDDKGNNSENEEINNQN